MLYAASLHIREQELVSLGTTGTLATTVTPEFGLVQQGSNMCGNVAKDAPDNGEKFIKTMGYILVQ